MTHSSSKGGRPLHCSVHLVLVTVPTVFDQIKLL